MISEQTFPHREAVDQAAAAQREADIAKIAQYLKSEQLVDGWWDADRHGQDILRLLGR